MNPAINKRIIQMRTAAKKRGKYVPSTEEVLALIPADMTCQVCKRTMVWKSSSKSKALAISLQHDDAGTLRLICFSCNSRHQYLPDDLIYSMPASRMYCTKCRLIKERTDFYPKKRGSTPPFSGTCKTCDRARCAQWESRNREARTARMRRWQDKFQTDQRRARQS